MLHLHSTLRDPRNPTWRIALLLAAAMALLAAGILSSSSLRAQGNPSPAPARACRVFSLNLEDGQGGYFDTSDRTGPIGEWVGQKEETGWVLESVDFESSQKPTGYPLHQVMVCLSQTPT